MGGIIVINISISNEEGLPRYHRKMGRGTVETHAFLRAILCSICTVNGRNDQVLRKKNLLLEVFFFFNNRLLEVLTLKKIISRPHRNYRHTRSNNDFCWQSSDTHLGFLMGNAS